VEVLIDFPLAFALGGVLVLGACVPSGSNWIAGVDVSHHQSDLDWKAMREKGVRFAYIKATEGAAWQDEAYRIHAEAARAQGMTVGAYHFFTFCAEGRRQAEHFLAHLDLRPGDLPPAVDVESGGNCRGNPDSGAVAESLEAFMRVVEKATGRQPLIYTTQPFYWRYFPQGFGSARFWLRNRLWCPEDRERFPFCQYSVSGIPGAVAEAVDRNAFLGGEEEFQGFLYRPPAVAAPGAPVVAGSERRVAP
jgi:lysozyme